jgi:hypothetical protein
MSTPTMSMKVRRDFGVWLKRQAAVRGAFVYELVEEFVSRQLGGKKPWREVPRAATSSRRQKKVLAPSGRGVYRE